MSKKQGETREMQDINTIPFPSFFSSFLDRFSIFFGLSNWPVKHIKVGCYTTSQNEHINMRVIAHRIRVQLDFVN